MIPKEFSNQCIVKHPTPYEVSNEAWKGTQTSRGVLDIGRVVYTKKPLIDAVTAEKIETYVNGIGLVELEPCNLSRC